MRPTDGLLLLLLLLGLVVGVCKCRRVPPWPCPVGGDASVSRSVPWPLVGLHLVKGAATEVVATEVVRVVAVTAEARAAVRAEAKVVATEVVRAVAEARAAASRGNASMDVGRRRRDHLIRIEILIEIM